MQLQREPRETLAKILKKPISVVPMLEPSHVIVREPDDQHVTPRVAVAPPLGPQVKDVMEVHVRKQRR
jgi:hypothetical protein